MRKLLYDKKKLFPTSVCVYVYVKNIPLLKWIRSDKNELMNRSNKNE